MKVYIRPLRRTDALTSYKWRNDSIVWQYTGHRPDRLITPEIELEWVDRVLSETTSHRFAICLAANDRYVGNVQLTNIKKNTADFHIFIGDRDFWGQGLATDATKLLIHYATDKLNLSELKLWVNPLNIPAIKVYLKCGFKILDDSINMSLIIK
ncbi:MAG: GNAT family N-acetyltransferase [Lentisphaeria bacterium]|nr:GNAT family N-acetyltransferase [Lentisphaeria bacterium]